jgi:hypothetical protein
MNRSSDIPRLMDMIFGRWRSQIIHAGVELNLFEQMSLTHATSAAAVSDGLGTDCNMLYRLMRALASLGLLVENDHNEFLVTPLGSLLKEADPNSMRAMVLLEEGQQHYAAWKYLPSLVREGLPDGFEREYGCSWVEYMQHDAGYRETFQRAMTSYSLIDAQALIVALGESGTDVQGLIVCDVGGGDGSLVGQILQEFSTAQGIVFDLPEVCANLERYTTNSMSERIEHIGGNMFESIPEGASLYLMKNILHDWSDDECVQILQRTSLAAKQSALLCIAELVVPLPQQSHFSKIFDIQMMCVSSGKQRTEAEMCELLQRGGWKLNSITTSEVSPMSFIMASLI